MSISLNAKQFTYVLLAFLSAVVLLVFNDANWNTNQDYHVFLEFCSSCLVVFVGIISYLKFKTQNQLIFLFLATGFLGTAVLDFYHMLSTHAWEVSFWPSPPDSLLPWSWLSSRFFLSILIFLSWFFLAYEEKIRISSQQICAIAILLSALCFSSFNLFALPRAYFPELHLSRPYELIPALFFAFSFVVYYIKGSWRTDDFEHCLLLALILSFFSQLFMAFSSSLFDFNANIAHVFKVLSYAYVLIGLMYNIAGAFARIEVYSKELQDVNLQLKKSNQDLEQFAYAASHDLQEPINSMISFSSLLEKQYSKNIDDQGRRWLGIIRKSSLHLKELIRSLLELSQTGRGALQFKKTDLNRLLSDILNSLETLVKDRKVQIEVADLPTITCDRHLLAQVFQNLITNAIKFTTPDQKIVITVGTKTIDSETVFFVQDNGIGMEAEYVEQIFTVFQRLHSREEYEGCGLGLAICNKIIDLHGGRVWVESEVGVGSTFYFTLNVE